jgi:carbamoyl-phosphate synthase large subunit
MTELLHRYLLPGRVARRPAARHGAGGIDYRLGHLPAAERVEKVRELVGDGLGVHTAALLEVATYDPDPAVLDALADAVAARQWEPVSSHRIAMLRLWARGWLLGRRLTAEPTPPAPRRPMPSSTLRSFARRPAGG